MKVVQGREKKTRGIYFDVKKTEKGMQRGMTGGR
jgi:hypothetical protein